MEKLYTCYISVLVINKYDKLVENRKIPFRTSDKALEYYENNSDLHLRKGEYISLRVYGV